MYIALESVISLLGIYSRDLYICIPGGMYKSVHISHVHLKKKLETKFPSQIEQTTNYEKFIIWNIIKE